MNDNYSIEAANDPAAPYNEKLKTIQVDISVTLSSTQKIEVPEDFDESDNIALQDAVIDQIYLPQDMIEVAGYSKYWIVDEFVVV